MKSASAIKQGRFLLQCDYFPLNMENIQMMIRITTIMAMMPTATPALKIPVITEQLLRHSMSSITNGKYNFFIIGFLDDISPKKPNSFKLRYF
jgi:hypothetical protein